WSPPPSRPATCAASSAAATRSWPSWAWTYACATPASGSANAGSARRAMGRCAGCRTSPPWQPPAQGAGRSSTWPTRPADCAGSRAWSSSPASWSAWRSPCSRVARNTAPSFPRGLPPLHRISYNSPQPRPRPQPRQASAQALGEHLLELALVGGEAADAFGELLRSHGVLVVLPAEVGLLQQRGRVGAGAVVHQAARDRGVGRLELAQQLGRNGEPVAARQRQHLPGVAEASAHHHGLEAMA